MGELLKQSPLKFLVRMNLWNHENNFWYNISVSHTLEVSCIVSSSFAFKDGACWNLCSILWGTEFCLLIVIVVSCFCWVWHQPINVSLVSLSNAFSLFWKPCLMFVCNQQNIEVYLGGLVYCFLVVFMKSNFRIPLCNTFWQVVAQMICLHLNFTESCNCRKSFLKKNGLLQLMLNPTHPNMKGIAFSKTAFSSTFFFFFNEKKEG